MKTRELMHHHPITIQHDASLETAAKLLQKLDVRHLPVLDGTRLVGILSDRDLAPVLYADPLDEAAGSQGVNQLMERDVISVSPDTTVRDTVDLMAERKIGALPVVDDNHVLVGIVSYVDVLRQIGSALAASG